MVVGHPLAIYHPSVPPRWPNTAPTACVPRTPVCPAALPVTLRAGHVTRPKRLPLRVTAGAATAARPVMIHHDDPRPPANRCSTHSAVQVRPARLQRCQRGLRRRCSGRCSGRCCLGATSWARRRWSISCPLSSREPAGPARRYPRASRGKRGAAPGVSSALAGHRLDQSSSVQTYQMDRYPLM